MSSEPQTQSFDSPDQILDRMEMADQIREMGEINKRSPAIAAAMNCLCSTAEVIRTRSADDWYAVDRMMHIAMIEREFGIRQLEGLGVFYQMTGLDYALHADGQGGVTFDPERFSGPPVIPFAKRRARRIMTGGVR